jgi:biopolymer transport protein ExbD
MFHAAGEEEPEFQISTMVDILMTLLLFFIATAQTDVMVQAADVTLPEAPKAEDPDKVPGTMTINIASGTHALTVVDTAGERFIGKPEDLMPEVRRRKRAAENAKIAFRVLIRGDRFSPYSIVRDVMKNCAEAGVVDVVFAATKPEET